LQKQNLMRCYHCQQIDVHLRSPLPSLPRNSFQCWDQRGAGFTSAWFGLARANLRSRSSSGACRPVACSPPKPRPPPPVSFALSVFGVSGMEGPHSFHRAGPAGRRQ
jgi:hypothetical protein